jgi:hypothetical protein
MKAFMHVIRKHSAVAAGKNPFISTDFCKRRQVFARRRIHKCSDKKCKFFFPTLQNQILLYDDSVVLPILEQKTRNKEEA